MSAAQPTPPSVDWAAAAAALARPALGPQGGADQPVPNPATPAKAGAPCGGAKPASLHEQGLSPAHKECSACCSAAFLEALVCKSCAVQCPTAKAGAPRSSHAPEPSPTMVCNQQTQGAVPAVALHCCWPCAVHHVRSAVPRRRSFSSSAQAVTQGKRPAITIFTPMHAVLRVGCAGSECRRERLGGGPEQHRAGARRVCRGVWRRAAAGGGDRCHCRGALHTLPPLRG